MRSIAIPDLPRSNRVRQRRTQESRDKLKAYKNRKRLSTNTPGVTVRSDTIGIPVIKRTNNRLRKKYTLTLGNGVEMLLPAIPVIHPGWRILSTPLFLLMGALIYGMVTLPEFRVSEAVISGADRISPVDIESISEVNDQPIFFINPGAIEKELAEAYPELTGVSVEIDMPSQVAIHIEEKEPLFAWRNNEDVLWIDAFGSIFPSRGEADLIFTIESEEPPPLMITHSDQIASLVKENGSEASYIGKQIDANIFESAVKLKAAFPDIETIAYNPRNGLGWIDENGMKVFIGISMDDIDAKLNMYSKIIAYLQNKGVQPSMISVAHLHAPFYRTD